MIFARPSTSFASFLGGSKAGFLSEILCSTICTVLYCMYVCVTCIIQFTRISKSATAAVQSMLPGEYITLTIQIIAFAMTALNSIEHALQPESMCITKC